MNAMIERICSARQAGKTWSSCTLDHRVATLSSLRRSLLSETDRIVDTLVSESGKVRCEALLSEIYPILDALRFFEDHAIEILAERGVNTSPFSFPGAAAKITRKPFGVVAILAPYNLPFQLTVLPALSALIAGNAVMLKLPETAGRIADIILAVFNSLSLPPDLVQCVTGAADLGEQVIDAGPDLVLFTGGLANGRKVMARAAQHPIPVILELGGKDPMIVFADAHQERAANAAVFGAFSNAGQVCVAVERCYVERSCYSTFVQAVIAKTASLQNNSGGDGDVACLQSGPQRAIVRAHYQDALARGAEASGPLVNDDQPLAPIVLWNVDHSMRVMNEETFGPLLPIMPFSTEAEAIALASESEYGLNASVWTTDLQKGERVARQLQTGNWAVNDVIKNIGHPGLPFGGTKKSGFGRYHGAEGLLSFTYPVSGLISRSRHAQEPNWFPYSSARYEQLKAYMDFLFNDAPLRERVKRNHVALRAFSQYASLDLRQRWENLKLSLPWKRSF